jgi:hypothetical protein
MRNLFAMLIGFGLVCATTLALTGCSKKQNNAPAPKEKGGSSAKGEPGWMFAEPNHEYHLRLHIDAAAKKATAKILDDSASELTPIAAESITLRIKEGKGESIKLVALGEKGKKSALFEGTHDRLAEKVDPHKVELSVTIGSKNLTFELEDDDDHHPKKK